MKTRVKTKILSITLCSLLLISAGCEDFLERPDASGMTNDVVFSTMKDAERVLAGAYSFVPYGFPLCNGDDWSWMYRILGHNTSIISDESFTQSNGYESQGYNLYIEGTLTPNIAFPFLEDKWVLSYQGIRSAYLFLENVDRVKDANTDLIKVRKAEARAYIGTKMYENFKRYGGLAWVSEYSKIGKEYSTKRLTIQQSVDSIISILDKAIPDLPVKTENMEFGRINKIAALAIKARTLLWSASPIFNPADNVSYFPSYSNPEYIKHQSFSAERWKLAAEAADETLNQALAGGYKLIMNGDPNVGSYKDAYKAACYYFPNDQIKNTEIIWGTRLNKTYNDAMAGQWFLMPWGKLGTGFLTQVLCKYLPFQNFVDFYEMKNGADQPADLYDKPEPYKNLDARFEATMMYHGYKLEGSSNKTMDMSARSNTDKGNNRPDDAQNFTGYYLSKFIKDQEITGELAFHNVFWPYIRLAEVYLMSAEAWNEYDPVGHRQHILNMINAVRNRAGQPNLESIPGYQPTQSFIRERIKRERAVELAYEEHRYFDLKRWKEGNKLAGQMYMMDVTGAATSPVYTRKPFKNPRTFSAKFYLFPMPNEDILKSDMIQNPGW